MTSASSGSSCTVGAEADLSALPRASLHCDSSLAVACPTHFCIQALPPLLPQAWRATPCSTCPTATWTRMRGWCRRCVAVGLKDSRLWWGHGSREHGLPPIVPDSLHTHVHM